ncbi:MAG: acetylxylan esterase, partial [Planctomycetota bacterium]
MSDITGVLSRLRLDCWEAPGGGMLAADTCRRFREACRRDAAAWARVESVADWERFRDERVEALSESLGAMLSATDGPACKVTGELSGEGHVLRKLAYEAAPGQPVPAHLYLPDPAREGMPGILICHSHHRPKEQAELQDMGVSWARAGAAVLVPDMPGHGERRDNEFGGRQDYYGRYYSGMQLHLVGESLMGWMVRDIVRGVDLLLGTGGVDPEKIVLVGAVAGGGDPVAVAAALDPRVSCSVPFNFGKAVRWRKAMPATEENGLNFCDNGSWEGTRNLRLSARDGFLRWAIVAACAPRPLVYAHEFAWEPEADPVWERLQKIYELYGARDNLWTVHGRGSVTGPGGPENTHCTNVGPIHRAQMYPAWEKWFGLKVEEHRERREPEDLACVTPGVRARFAPRKIHEIAAETGGKLVAEARRALGGSPAEKRPERLRAAWAQLLGEVEPRGAAAAEEIGEERSGGLVSTRFALRTEEG